LAKAGPPLFTCPDITYCGRLAVFTSRCELRSLSSTKAKPVNIEKATEIMREEYDFTDGARGKFSRAHVQLIPPIRLEPEVLTYLTQLAKEKDTTLNILVNQLLKKDIELIAIGA